MDEAHEYVDEKLKDLEKRITTQYRRAYKELSEKVVNYFESFEKRDKEQLSLLNDGKITQQEYNLWRLAQIGRGKRFEQMRDEAAERLTKANQIAASYINNETPDIFAVNYNWTAYGLEKEYGNIGFTIYNEEMVRGLIAEEADLLPKASIKVPKDLLWNRKLITAEITSGILQGESISKLADRFMNVTDANRVSAIRNARTFCTAAENAGRQEGFNKAAKLGIKGLRKKWLATKDNRTRHSHRELDGQTVEWDKAFHSILGSKMMFPGDKENGKPGDIYNCRCTMVTVEKSGIVVDEEFETTTEDGQQISGMNYKEWKAWKKTQEQKTSTNTFVPAKTTEEAENYANKFVESYKTSLSGRVDYSGIQLKYANEMNKAFTEIFDAYDTPYPLRNIKPFNTREKRFKETTAEAAYQWGLNDMFYNKAYYKSVKAFNDHLAEYNKLLQTVLPNIDTALAKTKPGASLRYLEALKRTGRTNVFAPDAYGSTIHEMGHYLDDQIFRKTFKEKKFDLAASFEKYSGSVSAYATATPNEYVAESFAAYWKNETDILDPDLVDIFRELKKK
ncbi:MAG: hypothetical protein J6Q10_03735 [Clostridia bacterium]|nr:hypothetical protein [Clostridia bacterium]